MFFKEFYLETTGSESFTVSQLGQAVQNPDVEWEIASIGDNVKRTQKRPKNPVTDVRKVEYHLQFWVNILLLFNS